MIFVYADTPLSHIMPTPLALQTLCFMKVADELESFSPDTIAAQLPPTQRSMLLLWLPVLDIIKLESTSVVGGIDMNSVWENLCSQRLVIRIAAGVDYPFEMNIFHSEGSWKAYYLTVVTSILLNPLEADRHSRFHSLDCIANMLLGYNISYLTFIPERYEELQSTFVDEYGGEDAVWKFASFLMEECHYKPKVLYISSTLFFCSPFYYMRSCSKESRKICQTLQDFLSDTQAVVFSSHDEMTEHWNEDDNCEYLEDTFLCRKDMICCHLMETILCSDSPKLQAVFIDDKCPPLHAELIISTVGDVCGKKNYWIKDENLHNNVPYKYLKRVCISMDMWKPCDEMSYDSAPRLTSAIKTQMCLEIVQFKRWPRNLCWQDAEEPGYYQKKDFVQLFLVLISLFKQPQFQVLELKSNSILHSTLRDILHTFFMALSPNHQTLKLESVTIIQELQDNTMPDAVILPDSSNTFLQKSLHLSDMELTPSEETLIFSYPLLKLESLALVNLTSLSLSKSLERAADLLRMNKISHLKALILKDIILCHFHPQDIVSLLLQSPNLDHVEIEHTDIGPGGLVASLPYEISKLRELCVLKLSQLDLGKQSERLFHQLCVAILSLPRVSSLTLDLSSNELSLHHLTVVLDIWKQKCSGKKLKELVLSGNDLEPGLLPLANIAEHIVY